VCIYQLRGVLFWHCVLQQLGSARLSPKCSLS